MNNIYFNLEEKRFKNLRKKKKLNSGIPIKNALLLAL